MKLALGLLVLGALVVGAFAMVKYLAALPLWLLALVYVAMWLGSKKPG